MWISAWQSDLPVRLPFPPASHQGSIYENQLELKHRYFTHRQV